MSENPFIGMRAFDYAQRARFFGREKQSYALYRLTAFGFIAVIGNSGSGKSSLVRAGLLPLLLDSQERRPWRIAVLTPGGSPIERLADAVATLGPEDESDDARAERRERIGYLIERSSNGIADALDEMPELAENSILIVVDQFEEIFRIASDSREKSAAFVALLLQLYRRRPGAHVLVTMRSDFIGDCAGFSGLPEAVSDTQYLVPYLSREQREAAIVKPIARAGATIEPTLVERLINEVGFESDQLPVLQHALARMWIAARERVASTGADALELTEGDYRGIGTLQGALSQHADAIMAELHGRERVVEAIFRALSERDAEGRATRRVLTLRQLVAETGLPRDDVVAVVDRFRAADCAFLLPAGGGLTPETRIDVVHEALLRRWERLTPSDAGARGWLDREEEDGRYYRSLLARIDSGETTLQLDRVTERYAWWTSTPRTVEWADRYGGRHERVDRFFAASLAALADSDAANARAESEEIDRRRQKERAARRFLAVLGGGLTIAVVLLVVTFLALLGAQRTTNTSLVAQSRLVSRDAELLADRGDATDAALLALEVMPQHLADPDRPFTWAAYGALTDAIANVREVRDYQLFGDLAKIECSPDGSRFIAHQSDGTIWIWKIGAAHPEHVLHAQSFAQDVEFSGDGRLVAAASNDGTIHLWNARTGNALRVIHAYRGAATRAVFSADGRQLLTSSADDNVSRLYDVRTAHLLRQVPGGSPGIDSLTLGTLGDTFITIDGTRAVFLWNSSSTRPLHIFGAASSTIVDAKLSRDDRKIAIAFADNTADIYDARTGRREVRLQSRERPITRIHFTRDATRVITDSGTYARVWDASNGDVLATIPTNLSLGHLPEFSRDGKKLVQPDIDGSIGVFSASSGARLVNVLGTGATVDDADFSSDGNRLLTASSVDGTVREWNISTNTSRILDSRITGGVGYDFGVNIASTRDGDFFAAADRGAIHVYDARRGAVVRSLPFIRNPDATAITEVAFSPDGKTLAASNHGQTSIELWAWKRSKRLPPFVGRGAGTDTFHFMLTYSPDGTMLASRDNHVVRIVDARTGELRRSISANHHAVNALQFTSDNSRLLVGSNDGWIRIFDVHTGKRILAFQAHRNWILSALFSPDGRTIASASLDQTVRLWNAKNATLVSSFDTAGAASSIAFSSDGKRLLVADGEGVRIRDIATQRTVYSFRGFADGIRQAQFVLHDTRVVTVGSDDTLRLWEVPELPACQAAIDKARSLVSHPLMPGLRDAEFITPRRSPSILNALLPQQVCS